MSRWNSKLIKEGTHVNPCPFYHKKEYGNEEDLRVQISPNAIGEGQSFTVICWICGAKGPVENSIDEAIASWNRRVGDKSEVS